MAASIRLGMEWYLKEVPALFLAVDIAEYGKRFWTLEGSHAMTLICCHLGLFQPAI